MAGQWLNPYSSSESGEPPVMVPDHGLKLKDVGLYPVQHG